MGIASPLHRQPLAITYVPLTNFYPRYGAANDQVDRILEVHPIYFQRIIPRYRLSTSETRDLGVGPMFDAASPKPKYPKIKIKYTLEKLPPWKGQQIDLLA